MRERRDVRTMLDNALGYRSSEVIWELMVEERYIEEYEGGLMKFDDLPRRYRRLARLVREASGRGVVTPSAEEGSTVITEGSLPGSELRHSARSWVLSLDALGWRYIWHWREAYLTSYPDGVLSAEQVTRWVCETGEHDWATHGRQGLATLYCEDRAFRARMLSLLPESLLSAIPDPPAYPASKPGGGGPDELVFYKGPHYLTWTDAGELMLMEIPTDGVLAMLKTYAYMVSYRYFVRECDAVNYILTEAPLDAPYGSYRVVQAMAPASRRYISMVIDPSLTAKQVAALYNRAREGLPTTRTRPLRPKGKALVDFCLPRVGFVSEMHPSPMPWLQLMKQWNRSHGEWIYTDETRLRGDYLGALITTLPPDLYPHLWTEASASYQEADTSQ